LSDEARSLLRRLDGWTPMHRYPDELEVGFVPALAEVRAVLAPAGTKGATVMLDRLFAVLPMPNEDGLSIWLEHLEYIPADVLRRAVDAVIRRHKWNSPPSIADVIEAAEADREYVERRRAEKQLTQLIRAAEQRQRHAEEAREREARRLRYRTIIQTTLAAIAEDASQAEIFQVAARAMIERPETVERLAAIELREACLEDDKAYSVDLIKRAALIRHVIESRLWSESRIAVLAAAIDDVGSAKALLDEAKSLAENGAPAPNPYSSPHSLLAASRRLMESIYTSAAPANG
jgi:hypothetical protein